MDEVSVFSWPICDPPIHIGDGDVDLSHGDTERVCLLYPAGARSVQITEPWRLHWMVRGWIIGVVLSGALVSWVHRAYPCAMIASV